MKRLIWLTLATGALTTAVALAAAAQPMAAAPNVSCGTIRTPLGSMHITASHGVSCKKARTVIDDFLTHGGRFVGTDHANGYTIVDTSWHCTLFMGYSSCHRVHSAAIATGAPLK